MECPNCGSRQTATRLATEWFPYGDIPKAFEATFPLWSCAHCHFSWRAGDSEEPIDRAMGAYVQRTLQDLVLMWRNLAEARHPRQDDPVGDAQNDVLRMCAAQLADVLSGKTSSIAPLRGMEP